ncbi:glycosyltransferase [Microvirga sp. W0021]|uniref:Glycosyltransferase n=1 Tax=Hohaiivirga grylli TaxID=3133970 RepID=A0ABV0BIX9_9HYPH
MIKRPKVSVIMPTYNHASFVREAIDSVLAQENVDFEFLIEDDGSQDNTVSVVEAVKDPRIIFFSNKQNSGACTVTNSLISRAEGEYIALINSDDKWLPNKLMAQVRLLDEQPNLGAVFGRASFIDVQSNVIPNEDLPFGSIFEQPNRSSALWLRHFFQYGNCLCHPTIMIRKECYHKLGAYNNRFRQLPDFEMWVRLLKHYDIHIIDEVLIQFRIMPGENASSQTEANHSRTLNEHFLIANQFFNEINKKLFIEGFSDWLIIKEVPTEYHFEIEKVLLLFVDNQWLQAPYQMVGLLKLYQLLNDTKYQSILAADYGINDLWFQSKMSEQRTLMPCPPPHVPQVKVEPIFEERFRQKLHNIFKRKLL